MQQCGSTGDFSVLHVLWTRWPYFPFVITIINWLQFNAVTEILINCSAAPNVCSTIYVNEQSFLHFSILRIFDSVEQCLSIRSGMILKLLQSRLAIDCITTLMAMLTSEWTNYRRLHCRMALLGFFLTFGQRLILRSFIAISNHWSVVTDFSNLKCAGWTVTFLWRQLCSASDEKPKISDGLLP